jgi:hypothetical protein
MRVRRYNLQARAPALKIEEVVMNRRRFIPALALALSLSALPTISSAVELGEKAPDFALPSTKDGKFKLSDNAGKKAVVVQFYVLDFTPT